MTLFRRYFPRRDRIDRANRGVTLIELLALLFFVMVIVVLVFPVISKPKTRERRGVCTSDIRQLGLGLLQYSQDYDNTLPPGLSTGRRGIGWAGEMYTYVKATGAFRCPSDTDPDKTPDFRISYAYNRNAGGRRMKDFDTPAKTVLLFEVHGAHARVDLPDENRSGGATTFSPSGTGTDIGLYGSITRVESVRYATGIIGNRPVAPAVMTQFENPVGVHDGGANYLFDDTHVKWMRPSHVSSGGNARHPMDEQTGDVVGLAAGTKNEGYAATFSVR